MSNYPSALDAFTNPAGTDDTTSPSHAEQHSNANDAIEALEAKLGINTSLAAANQALLGVDTGESEWGPITPDYVDDSEGSGAFVLDQSPTITSPTLTTPVINNPTLNADVISEYTSAAGVTIDGLLIKDGTVPDSLITPRKILAGTGSSWAWQSYTPSPSNITIGNGVQAGKYCQIGKIVFFRYYFKLGSTSAVASGPNFSLPVTAAAQEAGNTTYAIGTTRYWDNSAGTSYQGTTDFFDTSNMRLLVPVVSSTYPNNTQVTAAIPFTWTTDDEIRATGFYEAA